MERNVHHPRGVCRFGAPASHGGLERATGSGKWSPARCRALRLRTPYSTPSCPAVSDCRCAVLDAAVSATISSLHPATGRLPRAVSHRARLGLDRFLDQRRRWWPGGISRGCEQKLTMRHDARPSDPPLLRGPGRGAGLGFLAAHTSTIVVSWRATTCLSARRSATRHFTSNVFSANSSLIAVRSTAARVRRQVEHDRAVVVVIGARFSFGNWNGVLLAAAETRIVITPLCAS